MKVGKGHVGCALALAGTLFTAACEHEAPGGQNQPVVSPNAASGSVALLVPYGSEDENNTDLARNLENGARLAISDLRNTEINLKVYQTGGTVEGAIEAANLALSEGSEVILGPVFGNATAAIGPVAAAYGVSVFSFSNRVEIAGDNVYLLGHTHNNAARRILEFGSERGKSKVLVVHADTASGRASRMAVESAAELQGIEFSGAVSHEFSQIGVVNVVPEIAAAVNDTGADMLILTGNTAGALPMLAQLVPEAGIDPSTVQLAGLTRWDIPPGNLQIKGLQGGWFPLPDPNLAASFSYRYQYEYDVPPHPLAGLSYDGMAAINKILAGGGKFDKQSITDPFGFAGTDGIFRFNPDGTIERSLAIAEVRNSRKFVISPSPRAFLLAGS